MINFDTVLRGGRVIDPESGLDAVRDVAIAGNRVVQVGTALPPGRRELDVAGHVVTAGFIDLHSHAYDIGGARLQAMDGVTTALELEAGVAPVRIAYERAAWAGRPVNYGFATSWALAQMEVLNGVRLDGDLRTLFANVASPGWQRAATGPEVRRVLARLEADIADGALGIGVLAGYVPAARPEEYLAVATLAANATIPTFTHSRDLVEFAPGTLIDGAEEIVRAAGETGAHMHYRGHPARPGQRRVRCLRGATGDWRPPRQAGSRRALAARLQQAFALSRLAISASMDFWTGLAIRSFLTPVSSASRVNVTVVPPSAGAKE